MENLKRVLSLYLKESIGVDKKNPKMSRQTMFWILTGCQTVMLIVANIAVAVFIPVFGGREFSVGEISFTLAVTGAIFFFPLTCVVDDLQTELFGRKNNLAMIVSFGFMWLVTGVFYLINHFNHDPSGVLLPDLWTAAVPSTIAFLFSSLANSEVLLAMKRRHSGNFMLRFVGSTAVGQFFDTMVFTVVAVWVGLFPDWRIGWALFPLEYIAKIGYEAALTPVIVKVKNHIEQRCE